MKNFLVALIVLVVLVAAFVVSLRILNPEKGVAEKAAHQFMQLLRTGDLYDAYRSSSAVVRSRSFEAFETGIENSGITEWKSLIWNSVNVGSTESRFQGTVETKNAGALPVTVNLVREAGGWKVFSLASERSGSLLLEDAPTEDASPDSQGQQIPSEEALKSLVHDTMLKFNEAVQIKYFGPFYQQISSAWQQQTTPAKLDEAFKVFMDSGISFGIIRKEDARFLVPPVITAEKLLDVRGVFPTESFNVLFELKYIQERGNWRLFAINVNLETKNQP